MSLNEIVPEWDKYLFWAAVTVCGYVSYLILEIRAVLYWHFAVSLFVLAAMTFFSGPVTVGTILVSTACLAIVSFLLVLVVRRDGESDRRGPRRASGEKRLGDVKTSK